MIGERVPSPMKERVTTSRDCRAVRSSAWSSPDRARFWFGLFASDHLCLLS
jgi:hypothetical protein